MRVKTPRWLYGSISSIWFTNRGKDCKGWRSQFRSVAKEWSDSATLEIASLQCKLVIEMLCISIYFCEAKSHPKNSKFDICPICSLTSFLILLCTSALVQAGSEFLLPNRNAVSRKEFPAAGLIRSSDKKNHLFPGGTFDFYARFFQEYMCWWIWIW